MELQEITQNVQNIEAMSGNMGRLEQMQVQLSQRVDIFEEEIIKRVREI